jgi:predicted DNA-binding protein YlxM (UPF0122 family)
MDADDGMRLDCRVRANILYDLYAPLLTKRQRDIYEMRYFSDFSLAEIAEALDISRQAVHILVNRTVDRLFALEKDLGFATRLECLENKIKKLEAEKMEASCSRL